MATFIPNVTDVFPEPALFTPDFSFMDKMLQRREAMYNAGFAKVNNAYNLINRETTNPFNSKVKDQYLKQAKDNLKNLSTMDLSQDDNVNAANGVFAPFAKNTDVIGDQSLTAYWNQQSSIGNGYRLQDGGKYFNQANLDYITQQKNWFAQDKPNTWSEYYGSKRAYTPYYDWHKEVEDKMKNFKPDHIKTENINGFYINKLDTKDWNEGQVARYLDGVLSNQAKQQMRIEGVVKYGNDPALLGKTYTTAVSTQIAPIENKLMDIDIDIRREKDPAKLEELKKNREYFVDQQNKINNNIGQIQQGDMTLIRRNAEDLSYGIYYQEQINNVTKAYAHRDVEQTIGFNDVAKMFWENSQRWALASQNHIWNMEEETHKATLKGGEGNLPLINIGAGSSTVYNTKEDLLNGIKTLEVTSNTLRADLAAHINNVNNKPESAPITEKDFWRYVNANPADPMVFNFVDHENAIKTSKNAFASWNKSANVYAANKMGDGIFNEFVNLKKAGQTNTPRFNELKQAYSSYFNEFHASSYTGTTVNSMALALNPADKRWKAAAGAIQAFSGQDASHIGSIDYEPTLEGTTMRVTFQDNTTLDPEGTGKQNQFSIVDAKANLESRLSGLGGGATVTWNGNTAIIKNAPSQITSSFDPYRGLPYATRKQLFNMKETDSPIYGKNEFFVPFQVQQDGSSVMLRVVKQKMSGGEVYYIKDNTGKIITKQTLQGPSEIADFIRTLTTMNSQTVQQLINGR